MSAILAGHLIICITGLTGIYFAWRNLRRSDSDRIGAEEARAKSDKLAEIVLEATDDAVAIISVADYSIISANSVFFKLFETSEKEAVGKPCYAVIFKGTQPCAIAGRACPLQQTVANGSSFTVETLDFDKRGGRRFEEVITHPIMNDAGEITRVLYMIRDITARKLAEELLLESEDRYRMIFDNSGTAIVIIESDNTVSMVNKKFEMLLGFGKQEVEGGMRWTDFVATEDQERVEQYLRLRRIDRDAASLGYEVRVLCRNGDQKILMANMELIPGTERTICSLLDMTVQKNIEAALRESESTLALAQRIAHMGNWSWDIETNEMKWSGEMFRIFGLDPDLFSPDYDKFIQMVHPDGREELNQSINEALYAQKGFEADFRIILPDGKERMLYGQAEVIFDNEGKPLRMIGTNQDITWRDDAEKALRSSEAKFSKAFHASPDWIVISRASDGKYLDVNEAFLELTGYLKDEVVGKCSTELGIWNDAHERISMLKLLNKHGMVRNLEVQFRMKSGEIRTMLWSADVIEYAGDACLIAASRDMTDQRKLENDLVESQAQLFIKHKELKSLFNQMEGIRREWEQTLDCINDMFILADHEGRIKRFNLSLETFTGKVHRDLVGQEWQALLVEYGLQAHIASPGVPLYHVPSGKMLVLNSYGFTDLEEGGVTKVVIMIHDATKSLSHPMP